MAGLGDLIVVVEDLATYQAAVNAGKTSPSVMYLILAERQVYFNGELWSKAPEEGGGGGGDIDTSNLATKEDLNNTESIAASLFISHNDRLLEIVESTATKIEHETLVKEVRDNAEVIATALTDLDNRLKNYETLS